MILADVNVLVYAFDEASSAHARYRDWLSSALGGRQRFALVDTVLAGFLRVVTNPKIYETPAPTSGALAFVNQVITAPSALWIQSGPAVWTRFTQLADGDTAIRGNLVPDAYLASLAIANDARLATADRGFARFPALDWFDPGR